MRVILNIILLHIIPVKKVLECNFIDFRVIIWYDFRKGIMQEQIH